MVAAVSLALTAWGTYKAAQVADDQLKQSREQQAAEVRFQASRVTTWREPDALVFANRSLDPASAYIGWGGYEADQFVPVGTLPPCTAVAFPRNATTGGLKGTNLPAGLQSPLVLEKINLTIKDAGGNWWQRWSTGELAGAEWQAEKGRHDGAKGPDPKLLGEPLMVRTEPKYRPLQECGAAAD
ncbi:hypothetical protein OG786_29215 [Streptomyces sp. NBC_00101]|uniref:hypothetical protein n=1 Tax=Streptomyces sp. NBC_00101 TaxID=2975651 RepID=UPI003250E49A